MSRQKENKPAYQKPSIELITMDSEGSLLLTASFEQRTGGMSGTNAFGSGGTFNNRTTTRSAGTASKSTYTGSTSFNIR